MNRTMCSLLAGAVVLAAASASHAAVANIRITFDKTSIAVGETAHYTIEAKVTDNTGALGVVGGFQKLFYTIECGTSGIIQADIPSVWISAQDFGGEFSGLYQTPDMMPGGGQLANGGLNEMLLSENAPPTTNLAKSSLAAKYKLGTTDYFTIMEGDIVGLAQGTSSFLFTPVGGDSGIQVFYANAVSGAQASTHVKLTNPVVADYSVTGDTLITVNAVPEPATMGVMVLAGAGLLARRRRA